VVVGGASCGFEPCFRCSVARTSNRSNNSLPMLSSSIRSSGISVSAVSVICAMCTSLCMASKLRDAWGRASCWKVVGIGGLDGGGKASGVGVVFAAYQVSMPCFKPRLL
jgi:hypothetical protein